MKYFRLLITALAAVVVLFFVFQRADSERIKVEEKINGVNFVASRSTIGVEALEPIKKINAGWMAISPYAFSRVGSPELRYDLPRQWWGERKEGVAATVNHARELGLKIMMKPHVWVREQGWAGDFELGSEADWKKWEGNYRDYILSFARLTDSLNVEIFCIGTELRKATQQRPDFWHALIDDVREIYRGRLTYAANWDNYSNISFWGDLDYIGIDAYFPLSDRQSPTVVHLNEKWEPVKEELQNFAERYDKPVLFTEFGYRSVNFTADGHWKYKRNERDLNMVAQVNAYQALFETFWDEPWFAGGFLWKWFASHSDHGGPADHRFTPQNKPAEETIRKWFGRDLSEL